MTFEQLIERVLDYEGGYTTGAGDPGGETRWGISKRSYPKLNIKTLTRDQAITIYRRDFWQKLSVDKLPSAAAFQLLDFAINSGVDQATRCLQRVIEVEDDGQWGPISQARALRVSAADMVMGLLAERLELMTRLSNWPKAGKGWAQRIATNLRFGVLDL